MTTAERLSLFASFGALTIAGMSLYVSVLSYRRGSVRAIVLPGYETSEGSVTHVGCHVVNKGSNTIQVTDIGLIFDPRHKHWHGYDSVEGPPLPAKVDGYHELAWKFTLTDLQLDSAPAGFIAVALLGTGQILKSEWISFD